MKKKLTREEISLIIKNSLIEAENSKQPEVIKKEYLEKGGVSSQFLQELTHENNLEKKKKLGSLINQWKKQLIEKISNIGKTISRKRFKKNEKEKKIDIYLEGKKIPLGNLHPITQIIQKIYEILTPLGYQIVESPEVETEEYNFNKLNIPPDHPARDMHDTFYLNDGLLLRTHTSNTQIRLLENNPNQELRIISAGKVYRRDEDDATHTHQFTQLEGFAVGQNVNFSHLKGTIELLLKELFGKDHPIRFRPSYFPFTEPSVEVDAQCIPCRGQGCNICKKTGWVEILGAGLIHPQVLKNCGFDNQKFTGFAFGLGIERLLMIKYGVEDIRNFYLNDIRFLRQFREL